MLAGMRVLSDYLVAFRPAMALVAWFAQILGTHGYVDDQSHQLFPEHLVALSPALRSLAIYGALGLFKRSRRGRPSGMPTLVYVLLLLMLAAWALPALSFALDPYHVPVLFTLVAWLVIVSRSPRTDHFFNTFAIPYACDPQSLPQHPNQCAPTPEEVLAFPEDGKVVVVAASGGGIQASAWTARVLTGLEAQNPGKFARAIRLVSSVSGGSVGAMYFSGRYQPNGGVSNLPDIVEDAKASSLEDVPPGDSPTPTCCGCSSRRSAGVSAAGAAPWSAPGCIRRRSSSYSAPSFPIGSATFAKAAVRLTSSMLPSPKPAIVYSSRPPICRLADLRRLPRAGTSTNSI